MSRFRDDALGLLDAYDPSDEGEKRAKVSILRYISGNEVLGRENASGHLTGSALVVNADRTKVLLNHHAKLDTWMQFGGHVEEGDATIAATAFREAVEESGLKSLRFSSSGLFDIDVHLIPERGTVAAHYHYDLRFLLVAGEDEVASASEESRSVRWVPLGEVGSYTASESVLRMKRKVEAKGGTMLVTPTLNFSGDCDEAIRLYERAFGTKADFVMRYAEADPTDWKKPLSEAQKRYVYHAEMRIGGQRFFLSDIIEFEVRKGNAQFVSITFDAKEEVERAFALLAEGGEALIPLRSTTYSSCAGNVIDKYGVRWGLLTEQTER